MSTTQLTPEQRALVTSWTIEGIGPAEQARRLGLPVTRISATRRAILRAGHAPRRPRQPWKPWTAKETDQLISLIEKGTPYATIAKRMKRTEVSIRLRSKRIGTRILTTNATMSAREVAAQLGVRCSKTVSRWITRDWLRAANAGVETRPLWRISWDDLTAFLENPAYWIAWRPERIPDLALREWAQELRANEEPLLAHAEIAQRYGVGRDTIGNWLDKGWLPAVRYGTRRVPASALDGWVVPIDRVAPMNQEWPDTGFETVGRAPGAVFRRRAA
jgi:excisionase family DNA binding protein